MRGERLHIGLMTALGILAALLFVTSAWAADPETVLHSFRASPTTFRYHAGLDDGWEPFYANLAMDAAGNLYGTTWGGGIFNYGTIFKLTRTNGGWTESVLFAFGYDYNTGHYPSGGLTLDAAGNLYGTTTGGGEYNSGIVFELVNNGDGTWTEQVLHNFDNTDGFGPDATLIFDSSGNLYGTTGGGGAYQNGTAFELTPTGGGNWSETVLHSFGNGTDGVSPMSPLVRDSAGNLYGTTWLGGTHQCGGGGCGTVFELSPAVGGGWTEQVIHNFSNSGGDGNGPWSGALIFDASGNLYGTTTTGGAYLCEGGSTGCGTVYEVSPAGDGNWTEQVLYSFNGAGTSGWNLTCSLLFDAAGNLYGTTYFGGAFEAGAVFELTSSGGVWTEQVLHSFGQGNDGATPGAGLIWDAAGNLYGTTLGGGVYGDGTAYEVTP